MSGQQTVLTDQQQQAMQAVSAARVVISDAQTKHPLVDHVMMTCQGKGLRHDDACILLAAHLIEQVETLMQQVLDARNLQMHPCIMVCSEAERDAMLTLLHVKAL